MDFEVVGEEDAFRFRSAEEEWLVTWHEPDAPAPDGTPHGSEGLCLAPCGRFVMISMDGRDWGFPGGRPEGEETWREVLDREVMEEACAVVETARLLGFARSERLRGADAGRVLVRSLWRADVALLEWAPQHEILFRKLVEPADVMSQTHVATRAPIYRRLLRDGFGWG